MSVSNFLVVNIPTEKVSIKQTAINEVQKKTKKAQTVSLKTKIKKFKLTFKFQSHFNL